jgi:hypothetical protein
MCISSNSDTIVIKCPNNRLLWNLSVMEKYSNVIRFIVKDGNQDSFIEIYNKRTSLDGLISRILLQTGDKTFCSVGIWENEDSLIKNRKNMNLFLDSFRDMLEEISPDLGVTDVVSGAVVAEIYR